MSLANWKPTAPARDQVIEHTVVETPEQHEIYDHKTTPVWTLDAFLSGSPWQVVYFSQRLAARDQLKQFDVNLPPSVQSYNCYQKLELLVETALADSYNSELHQMNTTGSALLPSFMVPNVKDVFYTVSNLGRMGLFTVDRVSRLTHERESAYVIDYSLREEITKDSAEYKDLHRKTTETFVYSKQRLIENKNPILLKETYENLRNLHHTYLELVNYYMKTFFRQYESTLILPGQTSRIYDPYLMWYLMQIVSSSETSYFKYLNLLSTNNDPVYEHATLWTALMRRGESSLNFVVKSMKMVNPKFFRQAYFGRSATYGNMDYILYPANADSSVQSQTLFDSQLNCSCDCSGVPLTPLDLTLQRTKNGNMEFSPSAGETLSIAQQEYPLYLPISDLSSYVFSEGFYAEEPQSVMEIMVWDYLRRQPINQEHLSLLLQRYNHMERLEQFYYGPMLMTLIKETDRGAYA